MRNARAVADGILAYLRKTNQFALLPEIIEKLSKKAKKKTVIVETAIVLNDNEKSLVEKFVREKISKEAKIEYKILPDLIGGLLIKYEDSVWDLSLQGKIKELTNYLSS